MEMYADVESRAGVLGESIPSRRLHMMLTYGQSLKALLKSRVSSSIVRFFCNSSPVLVRRDKILALMERLDGTYASLKKESKDLSKPAEERSQASDKLVARETQLQSTYKQISLLYADLHEYVISFQDETSP
jgi:hypothetical protein